MPVARFEMPDGRIARYQVPHGTTPEQAQAMMESFVRENPALFSKQSAPKSSGAFDAAGARSAGYSDKEIAEHLAREKRFDADGARRAGYSDAEIVGYLQSPSAEAAPNPIRNRDGGKPAESSAIDLSGVPDDDLKALARNDMGAVSDATLRYLAGRGKAIGDAKPDRPGAMDALWKIQGGIAHELANKLQDLPVVGPLYRGGRELADGLAQGIAHVGETLGITSPETVASVDAAARDSKESYERTPGGNWRQYAPIAGSIATTLPVLGIAAPAGLAGKIAAGAATGAGYSAAMPVHEGDYWQAKGRQAAIGAAAGGALAPVGAVAGKVIAPRMSEAAQRLAKEGVTLTPGQIMGGTARKIEEAAKSMPFVGDAIAAAENRGLEQFNRAAINRALFHIGKSLPKTYKPGYAAVEHAGQQISKAYDDLLPSLRLTHDKPFASEVQRLQSAAQTMGSKGEQFAKILQAEVLDKFNGSAMTGETVKRVEAQLGYYARKFQRSLDPSDQLVFDALRDTQTALRKALERSNPQARAKLKSINRAFAEMLRVERAAGMQGAKEGIFTPNQLEAAVRALDSSGRKRSFARGRALMQDLATDGGAVLSPRLNNSGTADRMLLNALALGGGAYLSPGALAGGLMAAGAYSAPAQRVIAAALTKRPPGAGLLADGVERAIPMAGAHGLLGARN